MVSHNSINISLRVITISFVVATFVTYEKVLIKECYKSKDVTKILKNARKAKLQA